MQSILLISENRKNAKEYIIKLLSRERIDPIDTNLQIYEKAMGIEDVRNIYKKILLKPFRGGAKAVVMQAYDGITQEAQNALLKILEEPPRNTVIIILALKKELLLSTIISRCKIIKLSDEKIYLGDEDNAKFNDFLDVLFNGKIGDKLRLAQDIAKNKEETLLFLEKMSVFARTKLVENYNDPEYLNLSRMLAKTCTIINSTNVNQRVALENLFLSF